VCALAEVSYIEDVAEQWLSFRRSSANQNYRRSDVGKHNIWFMPDRSSRISRLLIKFDDIAGKRPPDENSAKDVFWQSFDPCKKPVDTEGGSRSPLDPLDVEELVDTFKALINISENCIEVGSVRNMESVLNVVQALWRLTIEELTVLAKNVVILGQGRASEKQKTVPLSPAVCSFCTVRTRRHGWALAQLQAL
jgi:hypothetical protein